MKQTFLNRVSPIKLSDVVDWGLCTGCGACAYKCVNEGIRLVNVPDTGIRPEFQSRGCLECSECLTICPGAHLDANTATSGLAEAVPSEFGDALEIWEGHATDPEIRHRASSGGMLTALALYCLEREQMEHVLHSGHEGGDPWELSPVVSRNRDDLLARAGSRYAPAAPCAGLESIEKSARECVFVGKPCDAAAVWMLRKERPELDAKLGLVLTFFCAGTPSTQGTVDLVRSLGVQPDQASAVRYRGEGWPGEFRVLGENGHDLTSLSYEESWGRLTAYRPLRCNLCPDGLGRIADIACGDAWHRRNDGQDPGRSLVIVRTQRGRNILHRAMAAGYVQLSPSNAAAVLSAQSNLLQRRRELFGRLLAMKLLGIPTPSFQNFSLFESWWELPFRRKLETIGGTLRRAVARSWWRRRRVSAIRLGNVE